MLPFSTRRHVTHPPDWPAVHRSTKRSKSETTARTTSSSPRSGETTVPVTPARASSRHRLTAYPCRRRLGWVLIQRHHSAVRGRNLSVPYTHTHTHSPSNGRVQMFSRSKPRIETRWSSRASRNLGSVSRIRHLFAVRYAW